MVTAHRLSYAEAANSDSRIRRNANTCLRYEVDGHSYTTSIDCGSVRVEYFSKDESKNIFWGSWEEYADWLTKILLNEEIKMRLEFKDLWIAKDSNGARYLYTEKPALHQRLGHWIAAYCNQHVVPCDLLEDPELNCAWDNSLHKVEADGTLTHIPTPKVREVTLAEIADRFGCEVKIVKEK